MSFSENEATTKPVTKGYSDGDLASTIAFPAPDGQITVPPRTRLTRSRWLTADP